MDWHPKIASTHPFGNGDHDPFLNGLEIFKVSDVGSNNLAGPIPDPVKESISGTTKIILKMHTTIIIEIIVIYILYIK